MPTVQIQLQQVGPATTEATIRTHKVLIDRPEAKGGDDNGPMGGELLLAALGGCFMSNLLAAIRAREADISNVYTEVIGTLGENPARFTAIDMAVSADGGDAALLAKLVTIAERACITANTLRDAVILTTRTV
ncbi:MAG: OsmC family protein [Acidobacteria bacterium]|nr:OsmC family protein [Acidobacteriota bacterium]